MLDVGSLLGAVLADFPPVVVATSAGAGNDEARFAHWLLLKERSVDRGFQFVLRAAGRKCRIGHQ
jgi:hypothetical protein